MAAAGPESVASSAAGIQIPGRRPSGEGDPAGIAGAKIFRRNRSAPCPRRPCRFRHLATVPPNTLRLRGHVTSKLSAGGAARGAAEAQQMGLGSFQMSYGSLAVGDPPHRSHVSPRTTGPSHLWRRHTLPAYLSAVLLLSQEADTLATYLEGTSLAESPSLTTMAVRAHARSCRHGPGPSDHLRWTQRSLRRLPTTAAGAALARRVWPDAAVLVQRGLRRYGDERNLIYWGGELREPSASRLDGAKMRPPQGARARLRATIFYLCAGCLFSVGSVGGRCCVCFRFRKRTPLKYRKDVQVVSG